MDKRQVILTAVLLLILCLLVLCLPFSRRSPDTAHLRISEICAKNESILADNRGRYPDYLELYNSGKPMDLTGYSITDGVGSLVLDGILLDSGEYRVFFLDQDAGFSLKAVGGAVVQLLAPDGSVAAQATTLSCSADESTVYQNGYYICGRPTPGFSNDEAGISAFYEGFSCNRMQVVVSEVLANNRSSLPDSHRQFGDAIELQNISQEAVSLSGWYLSDSLENRHRFQLPAITLSPGEFLLLFSDSGNQTCQDEIHINFGLSYGESLYLTDSAGNYQSIMPAYDTADIATVRLADGSYGQGSPSLGYTNDEIGISAFIAARTYESAPLQIGQVLLSSAGVPYNGAMQDVVEICNTTGTAVSTHGWYLTDSEDPTKYPLPQKTLEAGESLVIPCTNETTGFSLAAGETLRLISPDFLIASSVVCGAGDRGQSIQLLDDVYRYAAATLTSVPDAGLRISECMSNNSSYFRALDKSTCDWIELYNSADTPILLSDYSICDSIDDAGFPLPEITLAPGKYICILLSADGTGLSANYSSLPLSLSYEGDALYLCHNGKITDYVLLPALGNNESYGRAAGGNGFSLLRSPTPGSANSDAAAVSAPVTVLTAPGVFENTDALEVTLSASGDIYYTTNCTTPTRNSKRYTGPITVTQTTVLRVVCYEPGKSPSEVTDLTYLLNEGDNLSAISIVTEPGNLWNFATGIYADGPGYTETFPHEGANYWKDWEYGATITFFDQEGTGFDAVPFGLRIFGGYSRALSKKSFACMFRAKYGASALDYPVFGEEGLESYESIVLRAGGQEVFSNRIKDEAITSYVNSTLGIPVQKYRPVVLYLNGEYFGIYFIREKVNENYVAGNYSAPKEEVQLTYWSGKYNAMYQSLITYMKTNGLTERVHYDYIASQVDLQNYTDYMITHLWIANDDTANVKFFSTPTQPWTWVLYDTDLAMDDPTQDSLAWQLKSSQLHNNDVSCKSLLLLLLENEDYRDYFLERTAWQVNNVWNSEAFISHLDAVAAEIAADIPKECQRWDGSPASWERHVEKIRSFARNRLPYFLNAVQRHFGLTDRQMEAYGFILPDD